MLRKFVLSVLIISCSLNITYAEEIVLGADEWCPMNCEAKSQEPGYMIEIARKVFAEKGHTIKYIVQNWSRCIKQARKGHVLDGIIGAARTDAQDFIYPSESLGISFDGIFMLKSKQWKYNGLKSIIDQKKTLGSIKDYGYEDAVTEWINKNNNNNHIAHGDDPLDQLIKMLLKGKIHAFVEDPNVGKYIINNKKLKNKIIYKGKLTAAIVPDIHIAFSPHKTKKKKSLEYAKILSDGIIKMRKSGELAKILDKYGLKDWK